MATFNVYYNPDEFEKANLFSPYNLRKDLKDISKEEKERIAEEIANEVRAGIERPPTTAALFWEPNRKVTYAKIKVSDEVRNAGKSKGYRCIVLVDYVNNAIFLLHIYRHAHGENDNISRKDQNSLKKLVKEYTKSLNKQK